METCAATVDKTEFPGLLKTLWETCFKAEDLKAGFHKTGLCPLSKDSISKSSFAPSLPYTFPSQEPQTPIEMQNSATGTDTHIVHGDRQNQMTPAWVYLQGYFSKLIGRKKAET